MGKMTASDNIPQQQPGSPPAPPIAHADFSIGDVVRHRLFDFRGVIFDIDPVFANSEEWYQAIPAEVPYRPLPVTPKPFIPGTQTALLAKWLREHGHDVIETREPGGTSIGEQIREVIHDLKNVEMHPRTETLLYQAARAQIVEQVIKPRLKAGGIVISDRYYDSTIAYQGYGHQQDLEQVRALEEGVQRVHFIDGRLAHSLLLEIFTDTGIGTEIVHG